MRKDYSSPAAETLELSPGLALLNVSDPNETFKNSSFEQFYWENLGTE
jgi:hypothetical protein